MDKRTLFVWDFHGVLEKDNEFAVKEFLNRTLADFGVEKEISLEKTIEWYGLSWYDYFSRAHPKGNGKIWKSMHQNVLKLQEKEKVVEKYIKAREYSKDVLKKIVETGNTNIVISNSDQKFINDCTYHIGLGNYVDKIIGMELHHLSRTKEVNEIKGLVLTQYLEEKPHQKIVVIGDSESDVLAGKALNAKTYLFVGAKTFTDHSLKNLKPDEMITDLREVLKELN